MKVFMFKMENDPRIIGSGTDGSKHGLGRFIRKTSLDEFPQFWNVFKGDMSLVGTRPPTVDEWKQYEPYHRGRLAVKPGLTGMWQVSGRSDITDFEEVVKLDMEYVKNWNIEWISKFCLRLSELCLRAVDPSDLVEKSFKKKVPKAVMINNRIDKNEIYVSI